MEELNLFGLVSIISKKKRKEIVDQANDHWNEHWKQFYFSDRVDEDILKSRQISRRDAIIKDQYKKIIELRKGKKKRKCKSWKK